MIFTEVGFSTWCLIVGGLNLLLGVAILAGRGWTIEMAKRFPRSAYAGAILSALAFLWAAAIVYQAPLDFIARFKLPITVLLVVSIPVSWFWMTDLLSIRALGGLLVLLPAPVLVVTRFLDSGWRLVLVVLMYLYAIVGMDFVMAPYHGRDAIAWIAAKRARFAVAGAIFALVGLGVVLLPSFVQCPAR